MTIQTLKLLALAMFGIFATVGAVIEPKAYVAAGFMFALFIYITEAYEMDDKAPSEIQIQELKKKVEETRSEVDKINLMMGLGMKAKK